MNPTGEPKVAEATGFIHMKPEAVRMIKENESGLGEVIVLAERAGIQAVKEVSRLIPHIRSSESTHVAIKSWIYPNGIEVKSMVRSNEPASLESEALMAVITSLVTIFELCRSVDNSMVISDTKLTRVFR